MAYQLPDKIHLEIVTPDRRLFLGPVDSVTVPGREGYLGILPGHTPLLSELRIGIISFQAEREETRLYCGWGFAEVLPDRVSVLVEDALLAEEVDVEKAQADRDLAERMLSSKDPDTDFLKAVEMLESALNRLSLVGSE